MINVLWNTPKAIRSIGSNRSSLGFLYTFSGLKGGLVLSVAWSSLSSAQQKTLEQQFPHLQALRAEYIALCQACARAALQQSPDFDVLEQRRAAGLVALQEAQQQAMVQAHVQPSYACPLCEDRGYVLIDGQRRLCSCRAAALAERGGRHLADLPCFADDTPARIADDKQRQGQARLRGVLEAYVQAFPHNPKPNFLLLGQTGLGKTFFLGCTARALREKGQRVKYLSAYQLLELFRAQHFGERHTLPALIDVDFLAIDDLGTEPIYRNITIEYLQILLDERLRQHKHTAVTSNCLPAQLTERYGERVTSRLFDAPTTSVYGLTGADLRKTSQ